MEIPVSCERSLTRLGGSIQAKSQNLSIWVWGALVESTFLCCGRNMTYGFELIESLVRA